MCGFKAAQSAPRVVEVKRQAARVGVFCRRHCESPPSQSQRREKLQMLPRVLHGLRFCANVACSQPWMLQIVVLHLSVHVKVVF